MHGERSCSDEIRVPTAPECAVTAQSNRQKLATSNASIERSIAAGCRYR
jgi:hypothetical protein